jgi:hypothetical protein
LTFFIFLNSCEKNCNVRQVSPLCNLTPPKLIALIQQHLTNALPNGRCHQGRFAATSQINAGVFIVTGFMQIKVVVVLVIVTAVAPSLGVATDWQSASGGAEFKTPANILVDTDKDSFREFEAPRNAPAPEGLAQSDNDRGCCVYRTPATMCIYTNRGFCRTKAESMSIRYDFHVNKNCSDLPDCH